MAVYVTLKCDGMMPPGSKERCRAGFSTEVDRVELPWGGDGVQLLDVMCAARRHGWSDEYVAFGPSQQFCPSCTRHRKDQPPA